MNNHDEKHCSNYHHLFFAHLINHDEKHCSNHKHLFIVHLVHHDEKHLLLSGGRQSVLVEKAIEDDDSGVESGEEVCDDMCDLAML